MNRNHNPWLLGVAKEEMKEKQRALLVAMAAKAKAILSDEKFIEYKKMYEEYHNREIENIMMLDEQDPIKYAFKVRQVVDTLKAYRLLISSVEQDASLPMEESQ